MSGQGQRQSSLNVALKDVSPWVPDIDPRKNEKPAIITGSNFIDTLDGPLSYFSNNFYDKSYWGMDTRGRMDSFRIAGAPYFILGTQSGLWYIDPVSGKKELLLEITNTNPNWPWTATYVGTYLYFAQYNIGLWQYDPVNNTIAKVVTPVGDNISYVASSYGRLIFLGATVVGWSALDDGTNLTPDLASAAGAQPLSMIGGVGYAITVIPDGFLVYTSQGVLKATYTQQAYVFAWEILPGSVGIRIFSPNAAIYIPRVGSLSLDNTGFNLTREYNYQDYGVPQPWEIPMGDYIKKNIIANLNQNLYGTIDLFYCLQLQLLFVSFSSNTQQGVMTNTFVYSVVSKKWGSFDYVHTGVFEVYDPVNNIYQCAFMSLDGYIRYITAADFSENFYPDPEGNSDPVLIDWIYRPGDTDEEILATNPAGTVIQIGYSGINFSDHNPQFYTNYLNTGLFFINYTSYSDTMNDNQDDPLMVINTIIIGGTYINIDQSGGVELIALPLILPTIGLNSELQIGPFRFSDQIAADETSAVDTVMIGCQQLANFVITQDWNALSGPVDDWNADTGNIDWGFGTVNPNSYTLQIQDTDDGINDPIQGKETLPVWDDLGSAQTFKPMMMSSVYHNLVLTANISGQAFAVKTVDMTGLLTGRLQSA